MALYNQYGNLYTSSNSGSSWEKVKIKTPSGFNSGMDLSSSGDGKVMVLTYWPGGVSVSSDGGKRWRFLTANPPMHGYANVTLDGSFIIAGDFYGKGELYSYIPPAAAPRTGAGWSL
jgi:hypothetical protein